ncbi:hypothetical protein ACHAWF_003731 [Thalassiosira exigua]
MVEPGSSGSNLATSPSSNSTVGASINPAATPIASSTNEYSFFDEAIIYIRAGSGGQGSSTYKKGANGQNGPPDGGDGGHGGDVILELDESLNTLAGLARYAWRPNSFGGGGGARRRSANGRGGGTEGATTTRVLSFRAENGADGERRNRRGRNGKDTIVRVPPGTVVQEEVAAEGGDPTYVDLGTVARSSPTLVVASGGTGGEGSAAEKLQRGVRRARASPVGGGRKRMKLTLKVVADVALVAVPNAGKSTLLGQRCHVILHLLDATSKNILEEYAMINRELLNYGTGKLATMPQVVVVNKVDVAFGDTDGSPGDSGPRGQFGSKAELEARLSEVMPHSRLMWISAREGDGVDDLMERVAMFVRKVKEVSAAEEKRRNGNDENA